MSVPVKPIFLLADSQLLFVDGGAFVRRMRDEMTPSEKKGERLKAVYVGASNEDRPEFYDLFTNAMASVGVDDCHLYPTEPSDDDNAFFDEAHLVLLAGGDVRLGWRAFKKNGLRHRLIERYYGGAVLAGVSAGAVQLGLYGSFEKNGHLKLFETWKLVPAIVGVHEEPDWEHLKRCVRKAGEEAQGLGIPTGGAAVLHQDLTLEPVRRPVHEVRHDEGGTGGLRQSLLLPPQPGADPDPEDA